MQHKIKIPVIEFQANGVIEPGREIFTPPSDSIGGFVGLGEYISNKGDECVLVKTHFGEIKFDKSILYIEVEAKPIYK